MTDEELEVKEIIDRYSPLSFEFRDNLGELLTDIHYFIYDNLINKFVSQERFIDGKHIKLEKELEAYPNTKLVFCLTLNPKQYYDRRSDFYYISMECLPLSFLPSRDFKRIKYDMFCQDPNFIYSKNSNWIILPIMLI